MAELHPCWLQFAIDLDMESLAGCRRTPRLTRPIGPTAVSAECLPSPTRRSPQCGRIAPPALRRIEVATAVSNARSAVPEVIRRVSGKHGARAAHQFGQAITIAAYSFAAPISPAS